MYATLSNDIKSVAVDQDAKGTNPTSRADQCVETNVSEGTAVRCKFTCVSAMEIELVECPICVCVYDDPRLLPCQHTFCFQCLQELHVSGARSLMGSADRVLSMAPNGVQRNKSAEISCPLCRRNVTVPPEGVGAFPVNVYVRRLVELNCLNGGYLQSDGGPKQSMSLPATSCDTSDRESSKVEFCDDVIPVSSCFRPCKRHPEVPLDVYCTADGCSAPVCFICAATDHQTHR
jgi:hypothetical protein